MTFLNEYDALPFPNRASPNRETVYTHTNLVSLSVQFQAKKCRNLAEIHKMSRVMRKINVLVFDLVRHKPGCIEEG